MDKCSCGRFEYRGNWRSVTGCWVNINFCPSCGDQLLPDGRVIQRETVPNKLMEMLREVQATCPESGLQEFALRVFNWIEEMREQAGLETMDVSLSAGYVISYENIFLNNPKHITLNMLFRLLNAAKQEATNGV